MRYKQKLVEVCSERTQISGTCLTIVLITMIIYVNFVVCDLYRTIVESAKFYHLFNFVLFEGECCTIFEEGLGRVAEDNTKACHKCDFHYFSDEPGKTYET